jgi:RNA polymerase sigma-70 factor (ECF subfamily)
LKAPHYPYQLLPLATTEDLIMLLDSITGGNEDSLDTFYQSTKKTTFGLILRILQNQAKAEEVLIDVYIQIWQQASHYDISRGNPMAWLLTISRSRALDRLRKNRSRLHCRRK